MYEYESAFDLAKTMIIIAFIFVFLVTIINMIDKKTEQDIVKKSDGYIVYEECIEVQDNWYCK